MTGSDDEREDRRAVARKERRDAGDSSARVARELMQLPSSSLAKLGLDEDLREAAESARRITSMTARRRAERTLAGALRRIDLDALRKRMENVRTTGAADSRRLHLAEQWRTRLLDDPGAPAAFQADHPGSDGALLGRLIAAAQQERTSGRPPGAARALFRHITAVLDATAAAAEADEDVAEA